MTKREFMKRTASIVGALIAGALVTGCCELLNCNTRPDRVECGVGTIENYINEKRTCEVAPLQCGAGAHEQATGGQRECVPKDPNDKKIAFSCGVGTHQQEQATGGQRECVPSDPTKPVCDGDKIIVVHDDLSTTCRKAKLSCGDGTHEQATGGQRECVPRPTGCASGTQPEQATGGQRECRPSATGTT